VSNTIIYCDYAATTPLDKRVLDVMMPYLTDVFYNASSTHAPGMEAQRAVMQARAEIARHIGARLQEIVFTSGATEAINLAILGMARRSDGTRTTIVTVASEHAAVLDACAHCEQLGMNVIRLGVESDGRLNPETLAAVVNDKTLLVCVMAVNNETGVVQDLKPLADIAHSVGAYFMTDATQAYGKMPLNVDDACIDLMTFSAHKIYGPKGTGVLFMRTRKEQTCALQPLQFGGGQERGIRSGTLNVPGIIGLAEAGRLALDELQAESLRVYALRKRFEEAVAELEGVIINGATAQRNYATSNVTFEGCDADLMLMNLPHVACSKGSACSSAKPKPSHVLTAMGRTSDQAACSLRFSFGRFTTQEEIERLIAELSEAHEKTLHGVEGRLVHRT